jgi:hypothetical protein
LPFGVTGHFTHGLCDGAGGKVAGLNMRGGAAAIVERRDRLAQTFKRQKPVELIRNCAAQR